MAQKTAKAGKKATAALATLDREGLEKELTEARRDLYLLRMKQAAGELKATHEVRLHKNRIARALTFLSAL